MPQQKHFDLNLLRVFITVCRAGSFSKAAEELDLTQSSVSNAINRLKSTVGEALFIRVGRGVKPTAGALSLYEEFKEPLSSIEQSLQGMKAFDPLRSERTFHVYAHETTIGLLHKRINDHLSHLSVNIVFREIPIQEEQLQLDLQVEAVDLAIDLTKPELASFSDELLMQDNLVCVVRKGHPRISNTLSREQYFSEKHIVLNMRRGNLSMVDFLTDEVLPHREVYCEQSSILAMLATVANCDAIAVAAQTFSQEYAELFGLQVLQPPLDTRAINYHMVWSKKLDRNPASIWLRNTLKKLSCQ